MNKLPISVSLISGPEAARIGRTLQSVHEWTKEIVVVLNEEVQDGTEEIALRYGTGTRVIRKPWAGFRDQKNISLRETTQPWVLCLDADEEVSPELRAGIFDFFESGASERYAGAYFARKVWFLGRWITHGDWYPDHVLRLIKSGTGTWGGSPDHCKIILTGKEKKLPGDLYHYTNPTIRSYVEKINFQSDNFLQRQIEDKRAWSAPFVIIRSMWRFLRAYFFRLGFLDGFPGFFIAASNAYATLVRHSRLFEHLQADTSAEPPQNNPLPAPPAKVAGSR
jgi:glycosyltransferase involved in cell wall biosynthesis